ncbi:MULTISPECIES: alpha/beta hydrolase [Prochlorococcus]|uniref:alpha/beta hydrolase n=1 Tax=Prochlorococcus TaxID=1218 RepID=UPI0002F7790C|nr:MULTISPECIES: alpha/beta hydrolase [Prochlorococcus]KGG19131.1 Serine peptidase (Alpha/beta hydrolase) fused to N- terminal uncharacterized domain specific to cyanobacteria [Prochlorococcus marinus str. SS2]KGG23328.1 Serine peptidase (Alpha/beta hydrolase) fused to N- terminal uncharacterized domain specific to cyanobacteria [Prochlorococcus marinus str. SS35]KGG13999.1 Serine peptidase (Alpha/beta hydrolase) fused to N- terminal uncharacterized domain specific to cyanobacteria [Prochlorococ
MYSILSARRIIASCLLAILTAGNCTGNWLHAAERVDFHFDDMTIPIPIDELNLWNSDLNKKNSDKLIDPTNKSELSFWLNMLGFKSREALSEFLETPLVKDKSMARQLLRSWVGRKLLDQISDLVVLDQDKTGIKVFNTLEILLEEQETVSLLDLLKALPAEVIHLDLDGWFKVLDNWRNELKLQQKLLTDLRDLSPKVSLLTPLQNTDRGLKESLNEFVAINASHRSEQLKVQVWKPLKRKISRENWIAFMPGLGGDQDHFRWLARSLSHQGWEVVILDHPGSNTKAMHSLVEGTDPFPGGAEVFLYRLADLQAVLKAKKEGTIDLKGKRLVLMGHSLGALTAFFASGALPQKGLEGRCNQALYDLSITNLSRLLQCQIVDIPLEKTKGISYLSAIVGINSFGKLLWPESLSAETNVPVFLTGGTFDLITPAISEQLGLLLSTKPNKFSRALIVEGASHFSPIEVDEQEDQTINSDIYQISDALVGSHPSSVRSILATEIIRFLDNLEKEKPLTVKTNNLSTNLKFHIIDRISIKKIIAN